MPPSAICWSIWLVIPSRKILEPNRLGSISAGLPFLAHEPGSQQGHADHADQQQRGDGLAALLPHEDAEHDAAHPSTDRTAPIGSTWRSPV